jgi:translation initiation factor 1
MRLFAGTPFDQPPKCESCGKLEAECVCSPSTAARVAPEKQLARLTVEKRKKGKMVTVIRGLPAESNDLANLLSRLKSDCGAGGTIKDDCLEIQGEHLERVRDILGQIGYRVKG